MRQKVTGGSLPLSKKWLMRELRPFSKFRSGTQPVKKAVHADGRESHKPLRSRGKRNSKKLL
jgi:hypothetical protein